MRLELAHIRQSSFSTPKAHCAPCIHRLLWLPCPCCSFCKTKGSLYTTRPFARTPTRAIWPCIETVWLSFWLFHCQAYLMVMASCPSKWYHIACIWYQSLLALTEPVRNFGNQYLVHMVLKQLFPSFLFGFCASLLSLEMFYSCKFFHQVWAVCNGPSKGNSKPRGRILDWSSVDYGSSAA